MAKDVYQPERCSYLEQSLIDAVETRIDLLYQLDALIAQYAELLNRSQRLFTPRLTLPFLKDKKIANYGHDPIPLWCWQNKNSNTGKWFMRKIIAKEKFIPHVHYLKQETTYSIIQGNERPIKQLLKKIYALLEERQKLLDEMTDIKIRFGQSERRLDSRLQKYEDNLNILESKLIPLLPQMKEQAAIKRQKIWDEEKKKRETKKAAAAADGNTPI